MRSTIGMAVCTFHSTLSFCRVEHSCPQHRIRLSSMWSYHQTSISECWTATLAVSEWPDSDLQQPGFTAIR